MKALGGQPPKRTEIASAIFPKKSMRVILDYHQAMALRDFQDRIHFAAHARIMHRNDRAGPWREKRFKFAFVQIQRVRSDVRKNGFCTAQNESIDRRNEGE